MRTYVIRRRLLFIPTLFILSALVFFTVRLLPGDYVDIMQSDPTLGGGTQADKERLREMLGLDVPAHLAYVRWMSGILLRGTLGQSVRPGLKPAEEKILARVPVTLELGSVALLIGLVIALPVGIYSAVRQDTLGDYVGRSIAIFGLATPNFWLGLMVLIFPGIWWGWTPPLRLLPFGEAPLAHVGAFIIPGLILGTGLSAATMRMTRTMMLEVLRQDDVRTAWAKGLRERTVVARHAIKNALIPVVTLIGLQLPILVGGSVIIETLFNLPGLGSLLVASLSIRDYPMVSGINLFFATFIRVQGICLTSRPAVGGRLSRPGARILLPRDAERRWRPSSLSSASRSSDRRRGTEALRSFLGYRAALERTELGRPAEP